MATIRVKTGPNKGKAYAIADAPLTIGREETQVIQILDQGVSRAHAEVFRIGEMCFVRDNSSTNGTFVNGGKVTEESLKAGDELLIGTTVLVFEDAPASGESGSVEFEGDANAKIDTTSVELKVTEKVERVAGPATKEVESRTLALLDRIGGALRGARDLGPALEQAVDIVCRAIRASQGFLFLEDRATGKLVPRAVVEHDDAGRDAKVNRTIIGRVQQNRMPLLTTDGGAEDGGPPGKSVLLKSIKSVICVPVLVGDRLEGILYFQSSASDRGLSVEDLELAAGAALQLSLALANAGAREQLRKGLMGAIRALVTAMEIVDPRDQGHAQRTADYAAALAAQLGLSAEESHRARLAALLHDVGKLAVRESVRGASPEEIDRQHVTAGERILTGIEGFEQILPGVKYHHERADGSGFPYKVRNADTPVMARIVIVANAFDNACTRGGAGGQGLPAKDVIKDMAGRGGTHFDDDVIKALLICHRNGSLYGPPGGGAS